MEDKKIIYLRVDFKKLADHYDTVKKPGQPRLTNRLMAEHLGVDKMTISRMVTGKAKLLSAELLFNICLIYSISPEQFTNMEDFLKQKQKLIKKSK